MRAAGKKDHACREVYEAVRERRAANMRLLPPTCTTPGNYEQTSTTTPIGDLVWSTNAPEYGLLIISRGRAPGQYAAIVRDIWIRTLLRNPP